MDQRSSRCSSTRILVLSLTSAMTCVQTDCLCHLHCCGSTNRYVFHVDWLILGQRMPGVVICMWVGFFNCPLLHFPPIEICPQTSYIYSFMNIVIFKLLRFTDRFWKDFISHIFCSSWTKTGTFCSNAKFWVDDPKYCAYICSLSCRSWLQY